MMRARWHVLRAERGARNRFLTISSYKVCDWREVSVERQLPLSICMHEEWTPWVEAGWCRIAAVLCLGQAHALRAAWSC